MSWTDEQIGVGVRRCPAREVNGALQIIDETEPPRALLGEAIFTTVRVQEWRRYMNEPEEPRTVVVMVGEIPLELPLSEAMMLHELAEHWGVSVADAAKRIITEAMSD